MTSPRQEVVVTCEANPENKQPEITLKFIVEVSDKGSSVVQQGFVTIENRKGPKLKEYPIPDTGIFIYFSGDMAEQSDKIVSMLVKETDTNEDEQEDLGHAELLEFLELTKDEEAVQAYRSLAFYWTAIQSGLGFVTGDLRFEMEEGDADDDEGTTDSDPETDGPEFGEEGYDDFSS
tara:strand:- start:170056 stop:170586 length:531 start_codon:yes stop_codon:yes gene_type:complete